jgi:hypothetical protein
MQTVPHAASQIPSESKPGNWRARPGIPGDAVYRVVTVGAILLVLGTLWVF